MGNQQTPESEGRTGELETYFAGEFAHALDEKGRLAVPAKFRARFKEGAVVTRWMNECLAVFPTSEWESINAEIRKRPRTDRTVQTFVHFLVGGAHEADLDAQGRIGIPAHLRHYADIGDEVIVLGANDRLELWQPDRWHARLAQVEGSISDSLADLGI
ncbi:MAG TPA: division/cell wall cluster transcriptional repressor MraZ [Candidatus Limnocylindria bacterium]